MNSFIHHEFEVDAKIDRVWDKIASVSEWPTWAYYVRDVSISPDGSANKGSSGRIALRGLRPTKFQVTDFHLYKHWTWTGNVLFMTLEFTHRFERLPEDRTRVTFDVNASGGGRAFFGGFVRSRLKNNIEVSIPDLIWQLEQRN